MTQQSKQVRLRLGRNAWLAIIILAVALCSTMQPAVARDRPDTVIQRDLVYKRINGRALTLVTSIVLGRPPAHRLLSFGSMLEAGATAEKSNTFRLSVF